ncbi:hypothetical protein [Limimaricola hongkongensis]|uniref:DUF4440 domain-containing protein n=1 Tax=Limimaricola hongkongensis DSM 17492 TaxID=1122180 RepID=A0A017HBA9_9RHOB|nr:hypothetical protein [Limimaricola hongkongensis]EYD71661.1 hypothetical protein Lokhon_01729 [Limimaricola hongkongensis DSM 17492]
MHSKVEELWALEKRNWLDGADFYERQLAPDAAMVIPYPEARKDRIAALSGKCPARQWEAVELYDQSVTQRGETVLLSYRVVAWRDCCAAPLRARCASTYLDDDGSWLRLSHERETLEVEETQGKVSILRRPERPEPRLGAA